EPDLDELRVREAELAGDLPDLSVLFTGDGIIGGRHRKQAVEQVEALGVGRDVTKFACDQEVFSASEEATLALGDLDDERRLGDRQVASLLNTVHHLARLC